MNVVELARRLVVRTSRWPGLRTVYRELYDRGLSHAAGRLASVPGVLAVMLRAGDDGRTWMPGLSDYDLTVLTERHSRSQMFPFLDQIWRRYRSIKTTLPQLGEMEVMNIDEYADSLSFGPTPTASLKRAYPLVVKANAPEVNRALDQPCRPVRNEEFLLDALVRYMRFALPAWLEYRRDDRHITRRRAEHLLGNVVKRLNRLGVPDDAAEVGTVSDRMLRVFSHLSRACGRIQLAESEAGSLDGPDASAATEDVIPRLRSLLLEALGQATMRNCSAVAWTSYMTTNAASVVFVVPDEIAEDELRTLLRRLESLSPTAWSSAARDRELQLFFPVLASPVVMSRSMWKSWRELSPFDGAAVAATGRTVLGPHESQPMPSRSALRRGAEVRYVALLSLHNNWRPLGGPGPPRLYSTMVDHVRGYASAVSGPVLTLPTAGAFASAQDGFFGVAEELKVLRTRLVS